VRYGICVANVGSYSDPRATSRLARLAEASGWEAVFVWDHLAFVWGPPAGDPWITLAAVACATERVRLGTAVTPVARRRPHVLAQTIATLDVLSGGRVVFGAGLGGSASEFGRFGEPEDPRIRAELLDEGLDVLRRLLTEDDVRHRGKHFVVEGVTLAPRPVQGHVPIWIGGNRARSLARAARHDGWLADSSDPTGTLLGPEELRTSVRRLRAEHGVASPFDVAVLGQADRSEPAAFADAGATWWLENVHDRRGTPEEMVRLVEAGPPN